MESDIYDVSIIIPAFNEEGSIRKIVEDTFKVFRGLGKKIEIIIVNDGSTDSTASVIGDMQYLEKDLVSIEHRKNIGKSECLMDGFKIASGRLIGFIDADYQFHPRDFPMLLESLERGECDLANGFREKREDPFTKRIASRVFNSINALAFRGLNARDWNSGIKLMRAEVAKKLFLRKDFHRFILGMAHNMGYTVKEFPITHTAREFGQSKYGKMRILTGPFDVIALKMKFVISQRPLAIFRFFGLVLIIAGILFGLQLVYEQQVQGEMIGNRPAIILVALFILFGFQMFVFAFLAEKLSDIDDLKPPRVGRPFTVFGFVGLLMVFLGFCLGLELIYEQQMLGHTLGNRPAIVLVALFILFGFQMFAFGYVAEKLADIESRISPRIHGNVKYPRRKVQQLTDSD